MNSVGDTLDKNFSVSGHKRILTKEQGDEKFMLKKVDKKKFV